MKQGLVNNNASPGDKVNCPLHGNGVVSDVTSGGVRVKFDNWLEWYQPDGALAPHHRRTLRFGHDPAFEQPEELPYPELGTPVLFSQLGITWVPGVWWGVSEDELHPFQCAAFSDGQWKLLSCWKFWKPWPGTTNKGVVGERQVNKVQGEPIETSAPWQPKRGELCLMGDNRDILQPKWYFEPDPEGGHYDGSMDEYGKLQSGVFWKYCFPYRPPTIED